MTKDDKEYLRAIYAGLAMMGYIQKNTYHEEMVVNLSFSIADEMIERLDPQKGIAKARRAKVG